MDEFEELKRFRADLRTTDTAGEESARTALDEAIDNERPRETPAARRYPRTRLRWWLAGPAAAAALGLAAALVLLPSGDGGGGTQAETPPLAALLGGGVPDYDPARSPADVASKLAEYPNLDGQLVAKGTIESFDAGRIYEFADPDSQPTIVMRLDVDQVLQGELPAGSEGSVFVEFDGTVVEETDELVSSLEKGLPRGTPVLAYLAQLAPSGVYPDVKITNEGAGVPAGQPIFEVFTPQGLYLEDPASGTITQPQESTEFPDANLEDLEPSAEEFPPSRIDPSLGGGAG